MTLFGMKLSKAEKHLISNIKKTKSAFPEETLAIEYGLALMFDLNQIINEFASVKERPELYVNQNLFARNRQLLLNAYLCLLCSSYGTQFVILRTILENNNLMRLFIQDPLYAFEWLPSEKQRCFPKEIQLKYGKDGKSDRTYKHPWVIRKVFKKTKKEKVGKDLAKIYNELCDYTHPNSTGWQELIAIKGKNEFILEMPIFVVNNAYTIIGITIYLMQLSFKTFFETFKGYLAGFAFQLKEWQDNYKRIMLKYEGTKIISF